MDKVFISIGSNLGSKEDYCRKAIVEVGKFAKNIKLSSLYETKAVDKVDQPNFINCAIEIETELSPQKLLAELNRIEQKLGRVRHERWGPRTIDLDIIFYGDLVLEEPHLIIPHPRAHLREFVLEPICEIDPNFIYPGLEVPVLEILQKITDKKNIVKLNSSFTINPL